MTPFFFGESKNQLYGVLHPKQGVVTRTSSVVLCNAFGQEYMRSHRAIRQLAIMLSKQGYDVLRFDYRGTGDSALDLHDVDAHDWIDDINIAINEVREISSVKKVHVIGLRLGGLLAASACESRDDIDSLVFWDSVISGSQYIEELTEQLEADDSPTCNGELKSNFKDESGVIHFNGFSIDEEMRESLQGLNLLKMDFMRVSNIININSHQDSHSNQFNSSMNGKKNFESGLVDAPHDWNYVDKYGGILLPQPIMEAIVERLS